MALLVIVAGDEEIFGDLRVGLALSEESENFDFALGEVVRVGWRRGGLAGGRQIGDEGIDRGEAREAWASLPNCSHSVQTTVPPGDTII